MDNAAFIWCDIDGSGKRWRLAVWRDNPDTEEDEIYFPVEDFGDDHRGYDDYPMQAIEAPRKKP